LALFARQLALKIKQDAQQKQSIEVEQPVTRLPPHRSLRAELPHKALQNCSLAHGTD